MSISKPVLTRQNLCDEANVFATLESSVYEPQLFGVSDGKAVGTYFEQKFRTYLGARYEFEQGNSAKGIDFPQLGYLTISPALQWRLQYSPIIQYAGAVEGIEKVL